MLEKLTQHRQNLAIAAQRCESIGSSGDHQATPRPESPHARHAEEVNRGVVTALQQVEKLMSSIRECLLVWESVDRIKTDFETWLQVKTSEVEDLEQRPGKLHADAAEMEIARLQVNICIHVCAC